MTYYGPSCPICIEGYPASVTGTEPGDWARALCEQHRRRWEELQDARDVADDGAPEDTQPTSRDAEADPDPNHGAAGQLGSLALPLEALRLPPAPALTRLEGATVNAAVTPIGQIGGGAFDPTRFFFTDSWYWTCPARDLTPIGAHWRTYLMPPAKDEQSDCDDRGFSWRVWAHIWSGYQLTQGLVMGTHPWALVDGRPYPHWYNIHVDTHHQPWLVDFPFLAEPVPWPEKATANLVVY